jgi:beta-lactamase class A
MKKFLTLAIVAILSGAGVYFTQQYYAEYQRAKQERHLREAREASWQDLQQRINSEISRFRGEAGIVVKDLRNGREFSYNKTKLFPSASLAKIPIMAACFLAADQGRINLDRNIALKSSDKLTGSGVLKDMPSGTLFSVERLVGLMIYDSDNTAAHIVTNQMGMDYLDKTFKSFGLKNTDLARKIADYKSRDKGIENYTTAEDMALLLEKIYNRTLGNKSVSEQCVSMLKLTRMNDRIPKYLPGEISVAHKTGLEKEVCHDAGIVYTKNGDFIICVLTKHTNADSALSKEFIAKISADVFKYFDDYR